MKKHELTGADVRSHFSYDPLNGCLYRRLGRARDCIKPAGCKRAQGYIKVSFQDKSYLAHRLIWLWFYDTFKDECIDHINQVTSDNHIWNLRCVSLSMNQHNQRPRSNDKLKDIKSCSK